MKITRSPDVLSEEQSLSFEKLRIELAQVKSELQEFVSIASHDLQAPLRKVIAFSGLLSQDFGEVLGEEGAHYLDRIQASTEKIQCLLDDLLLFSRITSRVEPFRRISLKTIVGGILDEMQNSLTECKAKIDMGALPEIEGDPNQMRQLFQHLIENGLKFHEKGMPPMITILSKKIEQDAVEVTVLDKGIGFDLQYLDRIFKPFQRLHGNSHYKGSGMGLAICKKIVQGHGGNITASSSPGEGSAFLVRLPVRHHIP